jgi:hexokinase
LYSSQAQIIKQLNLPANSPIGYCFSYPAASLTNGDAKLLTWSKGVNISNMIGKPVGEPLVKYLNQHTNSNFQKIAVVNDTITSLFAGLMNPGYDAYIGLIVGTGTNMATFFPSDYIPKIKGMDGWAGETPVNLESGNFSPMHLTAFDAEVDANSDNKGHHRFEKAISGMYLGRVFRAVFPNDSSIDENIDAAGLSRMMNNPADYKPEHVEVAFQIYERSAKLVAASIAGVIINLNSAYPSLKKIQVLAEGSLFWSKVKTNNAAYVDMVRACLNDLLTDLKLGDKEVHISQMENANLIGAAMSVLS